MALGVPSDSRFHISQPIVTPDGIETFGLMKKFNFFETDRVVNYKVTAATAHRPDLIANEIYGAPGLFWVVLMFNKPRNPFRWPEVGTVIRLPVNSVVIPEL